MTSTPTGPTIDVTAGTATEATTAKLPMLTLDSVYKAYGSALVLRNVTLHVAEHEAVCLIGASGCGKSTLLRCVNLLEDIEHGTIRLEGKQINGLGREANQIRQQIGIVFQSYNLFPHLSVLDNITLAPRKVLGKPRREAEEQARDLLNQFGLVEKADEFPDRLSGGQQQRVAVVRALATQPKIMLLDEVTSALDPEMVGEVLSIIKSLRDSGMTLMLATHEMHFAKQISDRVCFLHEGSILEQGPPSQVLGAPKEERTRTFLKRILSPETEDY